MDLNRKGFSFAEWAVVSAVVAGATSALKAGVPQDNSKAQQVPGVQHAVTGFSFSVDRATTAIGTLQLVEDAAGTPVVLEQIELPVGFINPIVVAFSRPIQVTVGKSVTLSTGGSLGAGVKGTGVIRGFSASV